MAPAGGSPRECSGLSLLCPWEQARARTRMESTAHPSGWRHSLGLNHLGMGGTRTAPTADPCARCRLALATAACSVMFLPLCRAESHFSVAKHPFPTSSPPAKLCYPAVHTPCPAPGHQKHMHTHADLIIPSQIQRGPRMMCYNIQLCFSSCSPAYKAHSSLLAEVLHASSFAGQCFSAWALQTPGCFVTLQN